MNLFFTIILFAIPLYIIYLFGYSVLKGGPYAPVSHSRVKIMIKLLNLKKGQKMVDIALVMDESLLLSLKKESRRMDMKSIPFSFFIPNGKSIKWDYKKKLLFICLIYGKLIYQNMML